MRLIITGTAYVYRENNEDAMVIEELAEGDEVRVDKTAGGWLRIVLPDGRMGYLPGDVPAIDPEERWRLAGETAADVYASPSSASPIVNRLYSGTEFFLAQRFLGEGGEWFRIRLPSGGEGYIPASIGIRSLNPKKFRKPVSGEAQKAIIQGGFIFLAGLILTVASYLTAGPGERYIIAVGPVAYGLTRLVRGLVAAAKRSDQGLYPERDENAGALWRDFLRWKG